MANPDNTGDLTAVLSLYTNAWNDFVCPLLSTDYQITGRTAYSLTSDTAPVVSAPLGTPLPGLVDADTSARNVAMVWTLRTGTRGRAGRGRKYIGGVPETVIVDGVMPSGTLTVWREAAADFLAAVNTGSTVWCVYSQESGGDPLATGVLRPITAVEIRSGVPGSQRRRTQREATA
jgi:hypothetical protein